jgi:hypothetical protein
VLEEEEEEEEEDFCRNLHHPNLPASRDLPSDR